ncbi:hypothetical protein EVAR_97002_1 [Eumeta japonica]|uniref:Uncharacterized protein n=1 Tax=Eumeta variegata TaxID=151549 RepID=A0A4C2A2F5_EUMVA|nr:hypothetical protein EVAR_97002_1 [Eumeta japonica]
MEFSTVRNIVQDVSIAVWKNFQDIFMPKPTKEKSKQIALVDATYKFIYVDVGAFGRNSDGGSALGIARSALGISLATNTADVPEDISLENCGEPMPRLDGFLNTPRTRQPGCGSQNICAASYNNQSTTSLDPSVEQYGR